MSRPVNGSPPSYPWAPASDFCRRTVLPRERRRVLNALFSPTTTQTGDFDQDVAWGMAERGWGLWFTVPSEASMSSLYRAAIEGAQANRRGMWEPQLCGAIEQPDASLSLRISRGNGNVADETVTIRNTGGTAVDLTGWMLRDAGNAGWYTFPGGSVLSPGDYRTVHTGKGRDRRPTGHDVYRDRKKELYVDPGTEPNLVGDGAYLLDRAGNYRSWREYPCTERCAADDGAGTLLIEDLSLGKKKGVTRAQTQFIRLANRGGNEAMSRRLPHGHPRVDLLVPVRHVSCAGCNIHPARRRPQELVEGHLPRPQETDVLPHW